MTTLIDRVVSRRGRGFVQSYIVSWGHFLLCPWHYPCQFSKKYLYDCQICPELLVEIFFSKLAWVMSGDRNNKKCPQLTIIWTHPCHAYNSVYQGSHCSALLIGCVKFCSRLYMYYYVISYHILVSILIGNWSKEIEG